jgi:hypothetical protein
MRIPFNVVLVFFTCAIGSGEITPKLEAAVPQALPRTADGKPDMSGVWQAPAHRQV